MKRVVAMVSAVTMGFLVVGCTSGVPQRRIVFREYPDMKLGFTSQNFINALPVSVCNAKAFVDYARREGYSWIELRDPNAVLTVEECRDVDAYARDHGIEVIYAIQRGLLDSDFWGVFRRGVRNAAVFGGPRMFRSLATGKEFDADPSKLTWNETEFQRAVEIANRAAAVARDHGVRFAVENSHGDIDGRGKGYYGLAEFFDAVSPAVAWQLDTANFFWVPRVDITAQEAQEFTRKYASRMAYAHIKSARHRKSMVVLDDNPLDFATVAAIMNEHHVHYMAIELEALQDERQVYQNLALSIDHLVAIGLASIR